MLEHINIEVERVDFEPFARDEFDMHLKRDDGSYGDDYWYEDAEVAWLTWKRRASLAAERERELQKTIDRLVTVIRQAHESIAGHPGFESTEAVLQNVLSEQGMENNNPCTRD